LTDPRIRSGVNSVLARGESLWAYAVLVSPSPRAHYGKRDVIHKTGSTKHIATPQEEDRVTATGNTHRFG